MLRNHTIKAYMDAVKPPSEVSQALEYRQKCIEKAYMDITRGVLEPPNT